MDLVQDQSWIQHTSNGKKKNPMMVCGWLISDGSVLAFYARARAAVRVFCIAMPCLHARTLLPHRTPRTPHRTPFTHLPATAPTAVACRARRTHARARAHAHTQRSSLYRTPCCLCTPLPAFYAACLYTIAFTTLHLPHTRFPTTTLCAHTTATCYYAVTAYLPRTPHFYTHTCTPRALRTARRTPYIYLPPQRYHHYAYATLPATLFAG